MPSTAVASRQNSWKRIKHKYRVKDAAKSAFRERQKMEKQKLIAQRKGASKKA
jgi:hypothetical protein